ncbi:hypothetical protein [Bacillus sp. REN16]|uniref:hypothetical protein n=1 Tax=Bacillus sp. REN16 TaxID=2887296 RepID=UPI001E295DFC|nr:hypothetical protein [Bacillus sp. REN16]MCC3359293.1 hypothetical protein [Bacillus sp. REN16]
MRKGILFTLLFVMLTQPAIFAQAMNVKKEEDLYKIVKGFIPENVSLISPDNPKSTGLFQLYDFDKDGENEIVLNYIQKAIKQLSPSLYGAIIIKKENGKWKKVWETNAIGVGLDYSGLTYLTGDGTKEYLFGVTIGADAGNKLEVFKWENHSLKEMAEIPYHMMELIPGKKETGIAVWQRYIADTYFVDVLKWNGQEFIFDEELYAAYYPKIERFFDKKIANMKACFYWYTLADAQIKANLFDKAEKSIERGIQIAGPTLTDAIENFNKLKVVLKKKKAG